MGFEQLPEKQEDLNLPYFNWRPPTQVRVDLSFTRNLGNFESIKIGIGVDDYVRDGESVDAATDRVYKFVENKLISKTREVEEELDGNK
jgi:hypothetical protein